MRILRLLPVAILLLAAGCAAAPPQESKGASQYGAESESLKAARAGQMCGGFAGIVCDAGLFCSMESGQCGNADDTGVCKVRPEVCTQEFAPVCACDGKTYGNACQAEMAGAKLHKSGAC